MEDKPQPRLYAVEEKRLAVARQRDLAAWARARGMSLSRVQEAGVTVDGEGVIHVPYHVWRWAHQTTTTGGDAA